MALLELGKNRLIAFVIALLAVAAFVYYRFFCKKNYYTRNESPFGTISGRTSGKSKKAYRVRMLMGWGIYVLALFGLFVFTRPPHKLVPVVDNKKPDVTEVVTVAQGQLTGVYNKDHTVKAYGGIPFAKPPVGELRFKEPQEPDSWKGVRVCDHFGPMAMQQEGSVLFDSLSHILGWHDYRVKFGDEYLEAMSEDCLYLNVFTPEKETDELLPVIFYIHGGSLTTGHPSYTEYRGEDLAKKGVVYVDCAYRLGVFGYYAADDLKSESANGTTGNYGLLDQIAALTWVHDNIKAFGGDPSRITIAGESAGASSVNAICVSPLTKGLFQYAIAESSSIVPKVPFHTFRSYQEAISTGAEVRQEFGVETSDELRKIPAEKLVKTRTQNSAMTIDGYSITEQPYLTYEKGENHEKALLNGFNAKEADAFLLDTKATRDNYVELLAEDMEDYAEEMAEVVPWDRPARDQHFIIDGLGEAKGALNEAYSAMWFTYSHYVWNNYMVKQSRPAYEYYFTKTNNILSNYHAGELPYAYGNLWRHPGLYDESDYELSEIMQSYWVNFVYTGDPNGNYRTADTPGDGRFDTQIPDKQLPEWKMRDKNQDRLINFDTTVQMMDDPNLEIYQVIDRFMDEKAK
jgi:para-nitrobenzyl esterase